MRRLTDHRGSVLLLFPAGILVVVALAAVPFDAARVFLAQRSARSHAHAAAVIAADTGVVVDSLGPDGVVVDPGRARAAAVAAVAASDPELDVVAVRVEATTVSVTVRYPVERIFSPALPGGRRDGTGVVTATVTGQVLAPG